jgi:hypothetical protein
VQIEHSDGEPGVDDARLAVRLAGDANVVLIDLPATPASEAATSAHDFRTTPNIVFAGGVTTDIHFVNTDGGLRLAALVPENQALALIDPTTGVSTDVDLGGSFDKMSLVTDIVGATQAGADVALLWSTSSPEIALVALGSTVGKPYKAVERITLEAPIVRVTDVPAPNQRIKLLQGYGVLYALDLADRTASPLLERDPSSSVLPAPDGQRCWIYAGSQPSLAALDLSSLHPKNLALASPVVGAVDVERKNGGRALLALRSSQNLDLTIVDGLAPSLETAVDYPSILLGDLP